MLLSDTGFWFALINQKDKHHVTATSYLQCSTESLITTWPIITETCHLLGRSMGIRSQLLFLNMLQSELISIFPITEAHIDRLARLMLKYADLPMDLADSSLIILAEELGHGRILSTDQRDFRTYRWKNHEPFENLLLPED